MKHEGFAIKHNDILLSSSTRTIEGIDWFLEALEIVYCAHGTEVEVLTDLPEDILAQWSVEEVSEAKKNIT